MKITAKKLAQELLKNPDDIICVTTGNFEQGHNYVLKNSVNLMRFKGELREESFRDAFDGCSYSKEIVHMNDKGTLNFVKL